MNYETLNEGNKVGEDNIKDGYNGDIAHVSYHLVDGIVWVKAYCGFFRK